MGVKSGTAMSSIENTNSVSLLKCDCKKCYHSVRKNGILYCKYHDIVRPNKKECKRFSKKNDYSISKEEYRKLVENKNNRPEPAFPWERR